MTCQQIRDIVGNGWAVVSNPEFSGSDLLRGELIYFGYDKLDVYQKEIAAGHKRVFYMYCGKRDPNVILML